MDLINDTDEIGIVRGLAWTSVGGDTLQIEVSVTSLKRRIPTDRLSWGCDEGVRSGGHQLYPFCQPGIWNRCGVFYQK
ncbi:MAG: S16 family serine protease [Eubacterium sp.]